MSQSTPKGIATALTAFFIWSCFPFYFKLIGQYDATEIIGHRIVWTFLLLLGLMIITKDWLWLTVVKKSPKWLMFTAVSGTLIALNWLTYVWAVNNNEIVEASLGYFISPLVGLFLSFFVLKEPLRRLQVIAILFAVAGVGLQLIVMGSIPLISLMLAATFSVYGLMQRRTPLTALSALFLETALLVPFCIMWFITHNVASSEMAFWLSSDVLLLMLAGPITLVPLLLYNLSTKLVNFNTLSFMNYITPSVVFLLAVFYYKEPFDMVRFLIFLFIWVGLFVFTIDMFYNNRSFNKNKG